MNIVTDLSEWQRLRKTLQVSRIGFVPTMGNLHAGHLALCERAQRENEVTVVSLLVNPTQFNHADDFAKYPRTFQQDINLLEKLKVDFVFAPQAAAMYPDDFTLRVLETELSNALEGEYRPGHFTGMLTIVLKLFNLVAPTHAYFGEKDYQQLCLIKKMVTALFLPIEVIACPTVRDERQLALSSRNTRLSPAQYQQALHFPRLLMSGLSPADIESALSALGFKVDYIVEAWQRRLGAVWIDDIRLIDNVAVTV